MHVNWCGAVMKEENAPLGIRDRAFRYGDGFFETMISERGRIRFFADHLDRIGEAIFALHMTLLPELRGESLKGLVNELCATNHIKGEVRIRVQVWRAGEGRYLPQTEATNFLITAEPHSPPTFAPAKVGIYREFRTVHSPVSGFKGPHAQTYIMAAMAARDRGTDDLILLDAKGKMAECISSNLFWVKAGQVFTPALSTGCVNGIARRNILRTLAEWEIPCNEVRFKPEKVQEFEGVFSANVTGIREIIMVEKVLFPIHSDIVDRLREKLWD